MSKKTPTYPKPVKIVIRTKPNFEPVRKSSDYKYDSETDREFIFDQPLSTKPDLLPRDEDQNRIVPDPQINNPCFLVRPMDRLTVRFGDSIRFSCKVKGSDPLEVFWFKLNGDELVSDEKYEVYKNDGLHHLKIYNADHTDQGIYLCVVSNSIAQNCDSFYLNLRGN